MPIYEYVCSECGCEFELLRPLSQADEDASCPGCHKSAKRKLSTFAAFTKGESGFPTSIAGSGPSCSGCSATSCDTCGI